MRRTVRHLAMLFSLLPGLFAQQRVDMRNTYQRLLCVVPMVGAGTAADPRRPAYAPLPVGPGQQPSRGGILAFGFQVSDDGQYALVEFVARDRAAFAGILADKRPNVKVFEKGKAKKDDVETEFRKYKKNFDLDTLEVRVP